MQADFASLDFHSQIANPTPGFDEATQVGLNLQINFVSRVLKTHLNLTVFVDQPETMAIPSRSGEIKLDDRATRRHFGCIQPHMQTPDEESRIEVVIDHVAGPVLAPDGELFYDRCQLQPGVRQSVAGRSTILLRSAFHNSCVNELSQALRKETGGNSWHTAMDLAELRATVEQTTHDQHCPSLAE